jgi:hypothetical protein
MLKSRLSKTQNILMFLNICKIKRKTIKRQLELLSIQRIIMLMSCKVDWMKSFNVASFADRKIFHLFGHMYQDVVQEFLMILDKSFR